jgi:hypothetical protein
MHVCMNELDSVQIGQSDEDSCSRCGMHTGANECCREELAFVKLQVNHLASTAHFELAAIPAIVAAQTTFFYPFVTTDTHLKIPVAHSPPVSDQDCYIRNCVFRI